jgi:TRAP transporter TAXI family solute receptor
VLPALVERFGPDLYVRAAIPSAVYQLDADVPVIAVANLLVVGDAMPDTLAYDITRVIFERRETLASIHPQARELSLASAARGSPIPFHPGAIRYYREHGVWPE